MAHGRRLATMCSIVLATLAPGGIARAEPVIAGRAAVEPDDPPITLVARDATARAHRRRTTPAAVSMTLEAPTELTVLRYKPHVVLTWTHAGTSTAGYEIERSLGVGKFRRIGTPGREARTFRDRTSHPGFSYAYRIRAVGTDAVSPYSKEVMVVVEPDSHGSSGSTRPSASR